MKRIITLILVISLCFSIFGGITGCSNMSSTTISTGEWLTWINESFGMQSYNDTEPHIKNVTSENIYFASVQIAYEWGVINQDVQKLETNAPVRYRQALISLVNAGAFIPLASSDDEKLEYALSNFPVTVKGYQLERYISPQDGKSLLLNVQNLWANKEYEESIESITYLPNVKNYSTDDYDNIKYIIDKNTNTIKILDDGSINLSSGDIFVLPANQDNLTNTVFKAEEVIQENGYIIIEPDENPIELSNFAEDIKIQETYVPNLLDCEIVDGNGNIINEAKNISNANLDNDEAYISSLVNRYNSNNQIGVDINLGLSKVIEIDGFKVILNISTDNMFSARVEKTYGDNTLFCSYELYDIKVTNEIDYGFLKINSALVKLDYKTKTGFGLESTLYEKRFLAAPKYSNGNGHAASNFARSIWKEDIEGKKIGARTIKLVGIKAAGIGKTVGSVNIEIYLKISVDGTIAIYCTESGTRGIEYRNKNLRTINTSEKDWDFTFKAKCEISGGLAPVLYILGEQVVGFYIESGWEFNLNMQMHISDVNGNHLLETVLINDIPPDLFELTEIIDYETDLETIMEIAQEHGGTYSNDQSSSIKLKTDTCLELNAYVFLRIGLKEDTLIGKVVKFSIDLKKVKLFTVHIDHFDWSSAFSDIKSLSISNKCTLEFTPWDNTEQPEVPDEEESSSTVDELMTGGFLSISNVQISLDIGEKRTISIDTIPVGYNLSDIVFKSNNEAIVKIDKNGVATGIAEGVTSITVSTKDGKYHIECAVIVMPSSYSEFEPFKSLFNIPLSDRRS